MISNASILKTLLSELAELNLLTQLKEPTDKIADRWLLLALALEGRFSIEDLENQVKGMGAPDFIVKSLSDIPRRLQENLEPLPNASQILKDIAK